MEYAAEVGGLDGALNFKVLKLPNSHATDP